MISRNRLPALGARDARALRIGGWVLLPALLGVLVIRPLAGAWVGRAGALEQERALLARERRLVSEAPRDQQLLRAEQRALGASARRLFGGGDPVSASAELARYLARAARAGGLALEQAETETALDASPAVGLPDGELAAGTAGIDLPLRVSVRARGGVEEIVAFLRSLENGERLVRVERISITAPDESASDDLLLLSATISGFARGGLATEARDEQRPVPAIRDRFVSRTEP
jgi:Type II secretion system (T2SS), protein M subtype b